MKRVSIKGHHMPAEAYEQLSAEGKRKLWNSKSPVKKNAVNTFIPEEPVVEEKPEKKIKKKK